MDVPGCRSTTTQFTFRCASKRAMDKPFKLPPTINTDVFVIKSPLFFNQTDALILTSRKANSVFSGDALYRRGPPRILPLQDQRAKPDQQRQQLNVPANPRQRSEEGHNQNARGQPGVRRSLTLPPPSEQPASGEIRHEDARL